MPTKSQKADFDYRVTHHTMVHEQMSRFFTGFRRDAHRWPSCAAASARSRPSITIPPTSRSAPAHGRQPADDRQDADHCRHGPTSTISASLRVSEERSRLCGDFLRMCFAVPCEDYVANPVLARAMDRIFILHAVHEQNASTSTVRPGRFVGCQSFACIAAALPACGARPWAAPMKPR